MKLAVRRAILLPVNVKLLMSATGSTRALRMAMIISEGRDDDVVVVVGGDAEDCRAGAAAATSLGTPSESIDEVVQSFFESKSLFVLNVDCEVGMGSSGLLLFDGTDRRVVSTHSDFVDGGGDDDDAPNEKKGGRNDPGRDA
jgi:hypothetical protein